LLDNQFIDLFNNLSNMTQKAEKVANVAKAAIFSLAGLNYSSIVVDEYLMFD